MITINLHQPGKLNEFLQFPTNWNELLPDEVVEICKQLLLNGDKPDVAKACILHFIIHSRAKLHRIKLPSGWVKLMDAEQAVMNGYPLLEFIYNENKRTLVPERKLKLPGLFGVTCYGPADGFEDITCGEFEDVEQCINAFFDDPQAEHLAKAMAILWRSRSWRKRQPYARLRANGELIMYDAKKVVPKFLQLEPWRLYAVFAWYMGCSRLLPLIFPTVHKKHRDDKSKATGKVDLMAFTKCIHAGAGVKNGGRNQIRVTKLFEFMFDMEQEAIKAEEMTAYYESQRK